MSEAIDPLGIDKWPWIYFGMGLSLLLLCGVLPMVPSKGYPFQMFKEIGFLSYCYHFPFSFFVSF